MGKNKQQVPRLRFPGFNDAWEQRKLGECGNTFTGLSGKSKFDFGHGSARYITYVNVLNNPIADKNIVGLVEIDDKQNQVKYGDCFFTTSSETPEEVGMSSVWLENTSNFYLNSFCFGYRPTTSFNPYYLAFMLRSDGFRKKVTFLAQGISRFNISKTKVMDLEIFIPSLKEQTAIGNFFRQLDAAIASHQRKPVLQKASKIKQADTISACFWLAKSSQMPHHNIGILIFKFLNNMNISVLRGGHARMPEPSRHAGNRYPGKKQ